ncbi:hypothetical protein BGX27_004155, partial [Mortierella sp. AM989]
MATNVYLNWACDKEHKKEHVSFSNFVKKFDITDKKSANEAYLSLIRSRHIRENRRKRLHERYRVFRERNEDIFWERRALKIADRRLLINSAIVAKKTAIMNQKAGVKETSSGFEWNSIRSASSEDTSLTWGRLMTQMMTDGDESESEVEAETSSAGSIAGMAPAATLVDEILESTKRKKSSTNIIAAESGEGNARKLRKDLANLEEPSSRFSSAQRPPTNSRIPRPTTSIPTLTAAKNVTKRKNSAIVEPWRSVVEQLLEK